MRKVFFMLLAVVLLCGCSNDEPKIEKKIEVAVYESMAAKGNEYYAPQSYKAWSEVMLFAVAPSEVNTGEYKELQNGVLVLKDGSKVQAKYRSDTGVLYDVPYGSYTLVVYCQPNPLNGYLSNRFMLRQYQYGEANSVDRLECCFVWEDMRTGGGYCEWCSL